MPGYLRQSTASQTRVLGPFIGTTDYESPATSLTINATDVKLSKAGGSSVNKNSGGGTHIHNGEYAFTFDATDTATVGQLQISIKVSGALIVRDVFQVLEENVYDMMIEAGGDLGTTIDAILTDTGATLPATLSTIAQYVDTEVAAIKSVTDKLDTSLEDDGASGYQFTVLALENGPTGSGASAASIADAVWDELLSGHTTTGSAGAGLTAAGSAGDPWSTALPGAYSSGTAGYIVGNNIDAAISSVSLNLQQTVLDYGEPMVMQIVPGADYSSTSGTAIPFLYSSAEDLSSATASIEVKQLDGTSVSFSASFMISEDSPDVWTIKMSVSDTVTAALTANYSPIEQQYTFDPITGTLQYSFIPSYTFKIYLTDVGGNKHHVAFGLLKVPQV